MAGATRETSRHPLMAHHARSPAAEPRHAESGLPNATGVPASALAAPRSIPPGAVALALTAVFVAITLPYLETLAHDFDEAWLILNARAVANGLRPFIDFPHHEMPLHLYLLALFGRVFGQTLLGYRLLSLVSVAGSGYLLYRLVMPFAGPLPALVAQAVFLFSSVHAITLLAVPETPMMFFTLLGIVLLFVPRHRWSAYASGVAFAVGFAIKPTNVVVIAAAAGSIAYAREWRRLQDLAVAGSIATLGWIAWTVYASAGVFAEVLAFHVSRIGTRRVGMWSIDSGFSDLRQLRGIEHAWQWALASLETFYRFRLEGLPAYLLIASLLAIPIWMAGPLRERPGLRSFAVLWPAASFLVNFVVLDFVSARYFIPFAAFSAWLLAGWVWLAQRFVATRTIAVVSVIACVALGVRLASTVENNRDLWYWGRVAWISEHYPRVVSFSPMLFAATGTDPGCDFAVPALTYGGFGDALLTTERTRRFRFSDERIIACLRADPAMPIVVDWAFYYFTRAGSPLRAYLEGEGSGHRLFFSPEAVRQWDRPLLQLSFFR